MKLSARPLSCVSGVNDFLPTTQVEFTAGDNTTVYLQLVDIEKRPSSYGWNPPGQRYVPSVGATLTITFLNLDDAKQFSRVASQPFPQDSSIWAVSVLSSDPVAGTGSLKCVLTEGVNSKTFMLQGCLLGRV
jgi:hypothetical protein